MFEFCRNLHFGHLDNPEVTKKVPEMRIAARRIQ